MNSSISVVIPVYNSESSLNSLYDLISTVLESTFSHYEIILVDDGSVDNSYEVMLDLFNKCTNIKIIRLNGNFGQQNALMCAFHYASYDYVVTMDDDLQHPPTEILKLYEKILQGYDVVYGIPIKKQHSNYRNLGTKATDMLFNLITSKPKNLKVSSFRIINRKFIRKIISDKSSFVYISAITFKNTNKVANVYVNHNPRKCGKSNYSFFRLIKQYLKLFIYYAPFSLLKIFRSNKPQYIIKNIHM